MSMLNTQEAADYLSTKGKNTTPQAIASLARNDLLPGAVKDNRGRWLIPPSALDAYFQMKKRWRNIWMILGSIATLITILTVVSVAKDGLDLFYTYIHPSNGDFNPTSIPLSATPTQSFRSIPSTISAGNNNEAKVNETLVWGNNTIIVESIRYHQDRLIVYFKFEIGNASYTIQTCPIPSVTKSGSGELAPIGGGGVFADFQEPNECRYVKLPNGRPEGWAEYQIDPMTFRIEGIYSVKLGTNSYQPPITFEITK